MQHVISRDGTQIAYVSVGDGPAVILVPGALSDHRTRAAGLPLAEHLRAQHRVYAYDRRGRGESGDTAPWSIAREIEDIAALVAHAGGHASVYGMSSGAMLALQAAAAGVTIDKLALYDAPYFGDRPPLAADYRARLGAHVAAGRNGEAVAQFMNEAVGMPPVVVQGIQAQPFWPHLTTFAPSLLHDADISGDGALPDAATLARVTMPVLVMVGGASPPWMRSSASTLASSLAHALHEVLDGQTHDVDPAVVARSLAAFFA